ncbi:MAG: arylsulfatase, partial [Akkermansiaceae bacterium]
KDPKSTWSDRYLFTNKARWKTGSEPNEHQWKNFAVRSHQYRLVDDQLFDMEKDPGQKSDIAAQHPDVIKEMRAAYDKFWKEARPLMVNETAPMSPTQPFRVEYEKQLEGKGVPLWTPPRL